jgi:hypothetical protein
MRKLCRVVKVRPVVSVPGYGDEARKRRMQGIDKTACASRPKQGCRRQMNDPVDWTDETLRPLDELARIAFPAGAGVTADTLKRRARQGKLIVPANFTSLRCLACGS